MALAKSFLHMMCNYVAWEFFLFFFQAEDGIRDYKVTGVQTCALPIWIGIRGGPRSDHSRSVHPARYRDRPGEADRHTRRADPGRACEQPWRVSAHSRSGEGRVGEEWRSRWSPDYLKKKKESSDEVCVV